MLRFGIFEWEHVAPNGAHALSWSRLQTLGAYGALDSRLAFQPAAKRVERERACGKEGTNHRGCFWDRSGRKARCTSGVRLGAASGSVEEVESDRAAISRHEPTRVRKVFDCVCAKLTERGRKPRAQ